MSIVSCPRCGDKVSIPPAALPSALVQCPLCCEEYYLSDALIQLPPMLVVVGGPAATAQSAEQRLAGSVGMALGEAAYPGPGLEAAAPRPQLRTVSRQRRPEKSAVGEILKVVLGGAAGLTLGLLVLWWGFGKDVGDLAPQVSKVAYLRFLVPPKLWDQSVSRPSQAAQLDTSGTETAAPKGSGPQAKTGRGSNRTPDDSPLADQPFSNSAANEKNATTSADDPLSALGIFGDDRKPASTGELELKIDDPLSTLDPPTKKDAPKPKVETPAADSPSEKEPMPASPAEKPEDKPAATSPAKPATEGEDKEVPPTPGPAAAAQDGSQEPQPL